MPVSKIIRRELEVAFSRHSQPLWFRILKYLVLGGLMYLFWGERIFWFILAGLFVAAMCLHFWYRYKTRGWTKTYGMWKFRASKYETGDEPKR